MPATEERAMTGSTDDGAAVTGGLPALHHRVGIDDAWIIGDATAIPTVGTEDRGVAGKGVSEVVDGD